jgi:tetratricopeptide (TPR) repeat protein
LLEVEADMRRARAFLDEAGQIAAALDRNFVELDWGRGLIARWDGDLAGAQQHMRRALALAQLREDRWREIECLVWIAKIALEADQIREVAPYCDEIDAVASRVGDGPAPVADALRAVAAMREGILADSQLRDGLVALRALDDKAQLAYVLNEIAVCLLARGRPEEAQEAALEALAAARAVRRTTEIAVAAANLAEIAAALGDASKARQTVESAGPDFGDIDLLSARARAALIKAQTRSKIPTPVQTANV